MIALDASAMIAVLKRTDVHHDVASAVLESESRFIAHSITLAEVVAGGARAGRGEAMLDTLVGLGVREADRMTGEVRALARLRAETPLRMPDCCVLLVAESLGAALATFDERLAEVARSRGVTVLGGAPNDDA